MNKFLKWFFIICILLFGAFVLAKFSGAIQYYIVPTSGNEPTIKRNSFVFSSNLKKPKKFEFIVHERIDSTKEIWVQRLCGLPGDKIEIKKSKLFVNDSSVDNGFSINHAYVIDSKQMNWLLNKKIKRKEEIYEIKMDTFLVHIQSIELNKRLFMQISLDTIPDEFIQNTFNENWSVDDFGPIIVPENKAFVLGDNRSQSFDSRFIGFINESDIIGTVIGKK